MVIYIRFKLIKYKQLILFQSKENLKINSVYLTRWSAFTEQQDRYRKFLNFLEKYRFKNKKQIEILR